MRGIPNSIIKICFLSSLTNVAYISSKSNENIIKIYKFYKKISKENSQFNRFNMRHKAIAHVLYLVMNYHIHAYLKPNIIIVFYYLTPTITLTI